jgi:hypothetical protein
MHGRWFNGTIVLLWLASMTWLVSRKVLPPLIVGDPPNAQAVLAAQCREPTVGWELSLDGRPLGWALSRSLQRGDGRREFRGWVHIDRLPMPETSPGWFQNMFKAIQFPRASLAVDVHSTITTDCQGRISDFHCRLAVKPLLEVIQLDGHLDGPHLQIAAHTGQITYSTEAYVPPAALLGNSLSPQTDLPGLWLGQSWRVPCYSPLRPPNDPLEILEANVEACDSISWNGRAEQILLVTYRNESGLSQMESAPPQSRLWVRYDGVVLRQEVQFLGTPLVFERMPEEKAAGLAEENLLAPAAEFRKP